MINFNEQILSNQLTTINNNLVSEWKAKQKLYEEIRNDSSLLDSSLILQDFYNDESGSNISFLTDIKEAFEILMTSIHEDDEIALQSSFSDAMNKNLIVIPEVMPELNEQLVNEVFLTLMSEKRNSATVPEESILFFVASQCIYEGGPAVDFARMILNMKYPWMYFDDTDYCNSNNNIRTGATLHSFPHSLSDKTLVYPVPASHQIFFKLPSFEGDPSIEIYDLAGRFLKSITPTGTITSFDLSAMSPGAYTFRVILNSSIIEHGRFEVVK
jgi:hypothetical protein